MGTAIGTVGLILLGSALTLLTTTAADWLRDVRTSRRTRRERQDVFQRQTLLDLQDALFIVYRSAGAGYARGIAGAGGWTRTAPPAEENQQEFEARGRSIVLRARVEDAQVREQAVAMLTASFHLLAATTRAAADIAHQGLNQSNDRLNDRIGELLRDVY